MSVGRQEGLGDTPAESRPGESRQAYFGPAKGEFGSSPDVSDVEPKVSAPPEWQQRRVAQLQGLFPEAFSEGKVDLEKLQTALVEDVETRPERYSFTWAGKRDAMLLLQTPSRATLIPDHAESVQFEDTGNVFIEGENLEVLKLLYKSYFGRVKMIYIDPPYNTGNDFIYPDNYADPLDTYLKLTGQKDGNGNLLTSNPETSGRYHSAWLSMMYPRLFLARQLLHEDGVIFVSIDDHEVHNLRMLMNEVFGEENFVANIIWQKIFSPKNTARLFSADHDYILVYARNALAWTPQTLPRTAEADARYTNPDRDPRGRWSSSDLTARNYYGAGTYEVVSPSGKTFSASIGNYWRVKHSKFLELDKEGRIWWGPDGSNMPRSKRFLSEVKQGIVPQTLWKYEDVGHTQEAKQQLLDFVHFEDTANVLDTVKPARLIRRMLQITTTPWDDDIVMDFFAGSAAAAHAILEQNREDGGSRRFIMVQFPEMLPKPEARLKTIADIGEERIRRVIAKLHKEQQGRLPTERETPEDLGFRVFKLATSNYRSWAGVSESTPQAYGDQIALYADPLVDGWTTENVLYEVAIREGYALNCAIEQVQSIEGNTVFLVADADKGQSFHICLDDTLQPATLQALDLTADHLFICRDKALDDEVAANLALQCRLKTI